MISTILKGNLFYWGGNYTFASQTIEIMKFVIESGTATDIDELEKLYDDLNDYLSATTNYPGWIKGIYPIREDAVAGIENNTLFVVRDRKSVV